MGNPNKTWDIPVLMTCLDISRDIPKLNKNRWDITGQLKIKPKQMGYPGINRVTYSWISQDKYQCLYRLTPAIPFSLLEKQTAGISRV